MNRTLVRRENAQRGKSHSPGVLLKSNPGVQRPHCGMENESIVNEAELHNLYGERFAFLMHP